MPENTSATETKCTMTGCIAHGTGSTKNQKTGVLTKYTVHFRTQEEIMKHAIESMNRVVALLARDGKPLPSDRTADIFEDCSYAKTFEESVAEYDTMSIDKLQELARLIEAAEKRRLASAGALEKKK